MAGLAKEATMSGTSEEPAPGDDAPPGTPGTGEDICPDCDGTGRIGQRRCETCGGSGTVNKGIGGG
jgi:hypothetical protein